MTRLQRYLFRNLAVATFYSTVGLTLTIWLSQSLRLIEMVVGAGAPLRLFVWLLILTVPTFLGVILPIALMGGILFTYNRMTMDSELVVMRAAGVGPMALSKPAVYLAVIVSAVVMALSVYLTPLARQALTTLERSVRSDYTQLLVREGVFNEVGDQMSVYARARDADGTLRQILIHDVRQRDKPVTTIGERALLQNDANGAKIVVYNGYQQTLTRATGQMSQLYFDRYTVDLQLVSQGGDDRRPDNRERSTLELLNPPDDLRADDRSFRQAVSELHSRLSTPLMPLALTMLGLAVLLSGEFNRRGQAIRILGAVGGAVVLEAGGLGLTGLSSKVAAVIPAMYIVPVLVMIGGFVVLKSGLGPAGVHGGRARRIPLLD